MNPLYLSRVELKDFRTFGNFALDIPPTPGLILLVGTNGLGKSSFFDGIEWCLTGEVRRFSNHIARLKEADYLTRRDAEKGAHKATLRFNHGVPLTRTATLKPDKQALIDLLKSPAWGDISDVGPYLAFTHFLGQAAQQRFTSRKHNEQWEALKGPSGIDRLEEIRLALRGTPTTNAFRKRLEEEQLRLDQAETTLIGWRDLTDRLTRLREGGALIGVLPASELENRFAALAQEFQNRTGSSIDEGGADLSGRLIVLRQAIQGAMDRASATSAGLEPMRAIADRYLALVPQSDPTGQQRAAAKAAVTEATSELSLAELAGLGLGRSSTEQAGLVTAAEAEIQRLMLLRQLFAERERLSGQQKAIAAQCDEISTLEGAKQNSIIDQTERLATARDNHVRRTALEAQQAALREISLRIQDLTALNATHAAREAAVAATKGAADEAATKLPEIRSRRSALDVQIATSEQELIALRAKASDMADALARLAGHIGEHDQECPVCSSAFGPGILQSLANAAAAEQNGALTERARLHQILVDGRSALNSELVAAQQAVDSHNAEIAAAAATLSLLSSARDDIAQSLATNIDGDLAAVAEARLQKIAADLSSLLANGTSGEAMIASAEADIAKSTAELNALRERRNGVDQSALANRNALQAITEHLDALPQPLPVYSAVEGLIMEQQKTLASLQARQVELSTELATAHATEGVARQRLTAVQNEQDALDERIAAADRDMVALTAHWAGGGLVGTPKHDAIEAMANVLRQLSADLATMLNRHEQLAVNLEGLKKQEDLQSLIAAMETEAGAGAADDPAAHERQLQDEIAARRKALELTKATQEAVKAYSQKLQGEADAFSTQFLEPLNDMVENFNRALLSTPGETVEFSADHAVNRTQLDMQLRYADEIDNELYNRQLPPQLVLSEGQMAANGFSILCAASTAYPWSNWRALLLDDPLQHNDVIHAAAFVDLMRNLVEMQSYQLLMSTHDRAEGAFLARKFDAANLPCTVITLTAPSKEGVLTDPAQYNAAAHALMKSRLGNTA
ncbi:AAA family ATPase [Aminobacter anthyllidis]|uniref:AAA family ATPase n=1 Tax=Aminobacter anthyllidis TaxID=1035067 RepID=A0A9X1D515_9HYPH|nr:AAA family ATPase [Aminobacter anthyllidis]MBT1156707.1 AAA family ATPase [Aminobacter anthyllidis]